MMLYIFSFVGKEIDATVIYTITHTIIFNILYTLIPFFILVLLLAIVSNVAQFGFIAVPIKFNLQKLDPITGVKNIFSMKKLLEAVKLSAKLTVIFIVMLSLFALVWDDIIAMMDMEFPASVNVMLTLTLYFVATILFIIIIFAFIDFVFTRYYYFKSLRMTKQEVKDEHKQLEGDPQIKGRIRKIQREMAMQRMMKNVENADVVITNPTHYAVALQYDQNKQNAPIVVAKGIDFLALKIKHIAKEHNITIIENPPLARALYDQVELDQEIPEEFYKAIAEIFTYIYQLKGTKH
jgi:flagellar biosynthetic protein FlhB